ncbi:NACHT domain-containing protein [Haliscomenobacter hydrossis]|uniref:Signal transduction protein with Nacht domain n=1 Tax=Haliscomenobacter hydrossis (strain ATCC 27775 / DSM 1100 / LMG 10767 / O) TaxID=760192 RepID=F4KPB7_HALH1|nr:NACHT domain-containing protein [Haliscomenobacter hydrossis]AEE48911.1 putative signal transduction protein with Nacht domain [Haliscomenobacter hydrossis DSM 1100]
MDLKTIEKYLKSPLDTIIGGFTSEIKQVVSNRILEYQFEEYNRNLYSKTILHRANPKKLNDFYQPLFLKKYQEKVDNRIPTDSVEKLFKENQYLTIIGNAGSGKSTLIKFLFINCIDEQYKIPIKIELRYLNDFKGDLINYIRENIFKFQGLATDINIIDRLLESGKFLFFLDGYDELNISIKEETTKRIDDLVSRFNKNNYIITSRPHTGIELLPSFHNYIVSDLRDYEIESFVTKQIPGTEIELKNKIIEAIKKPENSQYDTYLRNPLLLSMFILTFQSYANIPQKKTVFYRQVFDTLFYLHDSISKLAYVREKESGLSKEEFEEILKIFSFISFFEEKFIFDIEYLDKTFNKIKSKKLTVAFDNQKLINDLNIAIGILNKEGLDYVFPHRSLQEYFAALYVSTLNTKNREMVYDKFLDTLKAVSSGIFFNRANFYSLLNELDNIGVLAKLIIPFYKDILTRIDNSMDSNDIGFVQVASVFYNVVTLFMDIETEFVDFHKTWRRVLEEVEKKQPKDIQILTNQENLKKFHDEVVVKIGIEYMKPCLLKLKPLLSQKINDLEQLLVSIDKSDEDIIGLIRFDELPPFILPE